MHVFQPIPVDDLELNPFESIGKDWALVSAGTKQKANTMTVSWGGIGVLWGKNVAFLFIRDSRYTKEFLDAGEFFSVSFMGKEYKEALNYCGSHSGRNSDKVAEAGLTWNYKLSIPLASGFTEWTALLVKPIWCVIFTITSIGFLFYVHGRGKCS